MTAETEPHGRIYDAVMSAADREQMEAARQMEGLAEEIAVMRVRLRALIEEGRPDARLLTQAMNALVRAVAVQYRLSPKAKDDLAANVAATLNSIADQWSLPEA